MKAGEQLLDCDKLGDEGGRGGCPGCESEDGVKQRLSYAHCWVATLKLQAM
jgi:hypothetical protein